MGGSTQQNTTQYQTQATQPWAPAATALQGILGNVSAVNPNLSSGETAAINALSGLGAAGNPYASGIGNVAKTLLGGGANYSPLAEQSYGQYANWAQPYLDKSYLDPMSNPYTKLALSTLGSDITNQINGMFAGAGRDLSGMNVQTLARGLAQGMAPTLLGQYNTNVGQATNVAGNLANLGASTAGLLTNLDQARLANMQAGIGAAGAANQAQQYGPLLELQAEAQRRGIPLQTLAAQMGMVLPAAQAFGTQSGTNVGNTSTQLPLPQQLIGGAIGGAGLLGNLGWKPFL